MATALDRFTAFLEQADRIETPADQLALPRAALETAGSMLVFAQSASLPVTAFVDPDPFHELTYPDALAAKRSIAEHLGIPLAKLSTEQLNQIDASLRATLKKDAVIKQIDEYFHHLREGEEPC
jgi:hypothetical protein